MLLIRRDSPVFAIAYNQHSMVLNCVIRVVYLGQVFMPTAKPPTKVYLVLISGSARPEVRGTAKPHGGAYPP